MCAKAQNGQDTIKKNLKQPGFVDKMQDLAKASAKTSAEELAMDKAAIMQMRVISQVRITIQEAKSYLATGLDTLSLRKKLEDIREDYAIAAQGVFVNKGSIQTYRNLTTTKKILHELLIGAKISKLTLDNRQQTLSKYRLKLDSLLNVPELFLFPKDSVLLYSYVQSLKTLARESHPVDSMLKSADLKIQTQLNSYNVAINQMLISKDEAEHFERSLSTEYLKKELPYLWNAALHYGTFNQILDFSVSKGGLILKFYVINNIAKLIVLPILILFSFIYLNSLKRIYQSKNLIDKTYQGQLVIRFPLLSAILLVVSLYQFVFISPPFIFNIIIWTIAFICLSIILNGFIARYWFVFWMIMVVFFFITACSNLILQPSRVERYGMLIFSLVGILTGSVVINHQRKTELKEKWIIYSIAGMVVFEVLSASMNLYGRYNLGKTFMIVGYLNVVVAISFLWVVRFINEGLLLAYNVYTVQDRKLFYLNFGKVGDRAPMILYVLLVFGWCVLIGRNFPLFDYLSRPILAFFSNQRKIGDYSFSINGLALFLLIMVISVITSKIVSFFASDDHLSTKEESKSRGLGSWILLVRIFILSVGLFLAIAAAGIPIDKITIIIGALGVGVGFGLQTLVNNLVSGLIIAFEKPVNVGDLVNVDGQGGTMKSIGFRSSVITTSDGADLVMPNGDLLNSHLMNWTLAGNRKRSKISIGIAATTDLQRCKTLIIELLEADERILKNPRYALQFEEIKGGIIDLNIYFWSRSLKDSGAVKSDVIEEILKVFAANDIVIPIQQHDVFVHDVAKNEHKKKD